MRRRPGFSYLDSAMERSGAVSILACEPDSVLRGRNWATLAEEIQKRTRSGVEGAAIGHVTYDGEF
ncbi:MAG: hypothetical protein RL630_2082, partial [Verrucomicrobiota bacterium]